MKKRKKILIADDESHIINLIKLALGERYQYLEALDGQEVLEILKKHTPNIILLDVMMPKLNGFEICEKLKIDKKTKNIPIVMVSAKTQEKDIIEGLKLGADYYITKPFDPIQFEEQIRNILTIKT